MDCIAHRGFAGVNPENTVAAVEAAADRADGIEVDVRVCGSGELVVHHDETVDRTTDGSGAVAAHTAAELAALSVEGTEEGVPTFADVVAAIPDDVVLHAELKERGTGEGVERVVAEADCDAVVSSFDPQALTEVEGLPTALVQFEGEALVSRARQLGCSFVHPNLNACDTGLVERAHGAGMGVNAWTVTAPGETERLRATGADGVITDFPDCCPS
ncbi:glycerophosphoryl diester phosphodiesterase [Halosimplex carlsbadense 2-9-1]|uniref:Glycerophosphoryl diester phosphodiesterase n=1 Tax=Halosimplex carlsbadense 2-9-1 TaxID=797114 RepID=M0CTD6_9EURY|nr:glycerophosphodiester phosphodiesterase [Halosimplex carlsbadense]ELZ25677.1 glycerophosphoryl diester phosphodiesterase [Halosimplex carlsbadense 2-9-1]